jgi:hypothetical protein
MIIDFPEFNYPPRAHVGDIVYYLSPLNRYAVKRSEVAEIREGYRHGCKVYEQVMKNGDIVLKNRSCDEDYSTFPSFEIAVSHIMATMVESINNDKRCLDNYVHNMKKKQRILATIKKLYPKITPQRYSYKFPIIMDYDFLV